MASNSPVSGLSQEEYDFIAAVIEDENYELSISSDDEYYLFTDWEGDGTFLPSITIMHSVPDEEVNSEKEKIDRLLSDYDWFVYSGIDSIEPDNSGIAHAYFYDEKIDSSVREKVVETL